MADDGCVFCAIVAGRAPAHVVDEDEHTVAFLDIAPFTRGHTLVIPRRHARDLFDVDADEAAELVRAAHRVAGRLRGALQPDGLNLLVANGAAAWQTVFHLHVHLIPRWEDDPVGVPDWPKAVADHDELAAVARSITSGG